MTWGATQEEWLWFDLVLGLGADLLPVVSNPEAEISPDSRMKSKGKTPSVYNRQRKVAGFPKWTAHSADADDLERWAKEKDYGICVQTRLVRGLDVDVPDLRLAEKIVGVFCGALRQHLPLRVRNATGKRLAAFTLPGDFSKRSFKVDGGLVEFLAGGQQFIAVGTHPSGTRYEWSGGLPDEFPTVSAEQFERAWEAIVAEFAVEPVRSSTRHVSDGAGGASALDVPDPVADWLEANWPTFGTQGGKLFVECPWKFGHSSDSGETEAAWLLAGTNGYQQGHYECLHASCSGRKDEEFLDAVGYRMADFDVLPALYTMLATDRPPETPFIETRGDLPLPGFKRDKQGEIEPVIENVVRGVSVPALSGFDVRYDLFRAETMVAERPDEWRPFHDSDGVRMRINLASARFKPIGKDMMRDAIMATAWERQFDTARIWLEEVVPAWDGVPRIERSLSTYFRADDTEYTRACGEYLWTALASRVLDPGCQADMALVFVSPEQGMRKSSGVAALSPSRDFFGEVNLEVRDADLSRKLRGKLVIELAEMRGLKTRDSESIKAWVTQRYEEWTPKFMEANTKFARRCILIGTTNDEQFLGDPTGERRWLPMKVKGQAHTALLERDRLQLWAEGRDRWRAEGQLWEKAEKLAKKEHGAFKEHDTWEDAIREWLGEVAMDDTTPLTKGFVRSSEVLTGALGFDPKHVKKSEEMRVARALAAVGMVRGDFWHDGKSIKGWFYA